MSVIYDHSSVLAIMAAKIEEPSAQGFRSTKQVGLFSRQLKIASLALKRRLSVLKFNVENPYDMLYETYWGVVFQE